MLYTRATLTLQKLNLITNAVSPLKPCTAHNKPRKSMIGSWLRLRISCRPRKLRLARMYMLTAPRLVLMLCAASMLSACAGQAGLNQFDVAPVAVKPNLAEPPKWMLGGCPKLRPLPDKAMSQKNVEDSWGPDTAAYEACRLRYYALRKYYKERDAALSATP